MFSFCPMFMWWHVNVREYSGGTLMAVCPSSGNWKWSWLHIERAECAVSVQEWRNVNENDWFIRIESHSDVDCNHSNLKMNTTINLVSKTNWFVIRLIRYSIEVQKKIVHQPSSWRYKKKSFRSRIRLVRNVFIFGPRMRVPPRRAVCFLRRSRAFGARPCELEEK